MIVACRCSSLWISSCKCDSFHKIQEHGSLCPAQESRPRLVEVWTGDAATSMKNMMKIVFLVVSRPPVLFTQEKSVNNLVVSYSHVRCFSWSLTKIQADKKPNLKRDQNSTRCHKQGLRRKFLKRSKNPVYFFIHAI